MQENLVALDVLVFSKKCTHEKLASMPIHDQIKKRREALGWSHQRLADEVSAKEGAKKSLSWQTVQQWENGKSAPKRVRLEHVASALGCSIQELLNPLDTPVTTDQRKSGAAIEVQLDNNPELPAVRRVAFKLCAGASGFGVEYVDENDDEPIVFRRHWFESRGLKPEKLFAVRVSNGSMQPGLWDGDTVVVNTADTNPKDGAVFAVNYEGEMVVKRLVRDEGRWWLKSDNPDQGRYPRKACDENVMLIGIIVHKQSERI